jgi:hypothetical protein
MQPINNKRFYSPQFSALAAISVRRLAWSLGLSMPAAVDHIVRLLPSMVDPSKVCLACQDRSKCASCVFGSLGNQQAPTGVAAGL